MSSQHAQSGLHVLLCVLPFSIAPLVSGCVETLVPADDAGAMPADDAGTTPEADGGDAALSTDTGVVVPDGMVASPDAPATGDGSVAADACALLDFFADADMDGFGDPAISLSACVAPTGYVGNGDDCDDTAMGVSPDGTERCDLARIDEDCSGAPNEGCECDETQTQPCPGGSDVGECVAGTQTCDATGHWGACMGDVMPTGEICNGLDDDCDGADDGAAAVTACGTPAGVATATCGGASGCAVGTCMTNRGDCNATFTDGCEITYGSLAHCTACGDVCGWDCEGTATGCNDVALTTAGSAPVVGTAIAAGGDFTCALRDDGTVVCWGNDADGQLGDGSPLVARNYPRPVTGLVGATAIAAGTSHACALVSGTVQCWGDNDHGQLGNSGTTDSSVPVLVSGLTNAIAIDAGEDFTCAVRSTGRVACWGADVYLQLGNGVTSGDQTAPVEVLNLGVSTGSAVAISTGDRHACAIVNGAAFGTQRLFCWGFNVAGQLGDGSTLSRHTPVEVMGGYTGYTRVAAGGRHTCASTLSGSTHALRCWGENGDGALGDGTTMDRSLPVAVVGVVASRVTHLTAGGTHTCVRLSDEALYCWGGNVSGQLGDSTMTTRTMPVSVVEPGIPPTPYPAARIAAGAAHTCAIEASGLPTCWGTNASFRLGVPTILGSSTPVNVTAP